MLCAHIWQFAATTVTKKNTKTMYSPDKYVYVQRHTPIQSISKIIWKSSREGNSMKRAVYYWANKQATNEASANAHTTKKKKKITIKKGKIKIKSVFDKWYSTWSLKHWSNSSRWFVLSSNFPLLPFILFAFKSYCQKQYVNFCSRGHQYAFVATFKIDLNFSQTELDQIFIFQTIDEWNGRKGKVKYKMHNNRIFTAMVNNDSRTSRPSVVYWRHAMTYGTVGGRIDWSNRKVYRNIRPSDDLNRRNWQQTIESDIWKCCFILHCMKFIFNGFFIASHSFTRSLSISLSLHNDWTYLDAYA